MALQEHLKFSLLMMIMRKLQLVKTKEQLKAAHLITSNDYLVSPLWWLALGNGGDGCGHGQAGRHHRSFVTNRVLVLLLEL